VRDPTPLSIDRTPYFFLGRRPFREGRLRAYIHREHRNGRSLQQILDDPLVERLGGQSLAWRTLVSADMIAALEHDVADAIESCRPRPVTRPATSRPASSSREVDHDLNGA
jgi:hypothetical protein